KKALKEMFLDGEVPLISLCKSADEHQQDAEAEENDRQPQRAEKLRQPKQRRLPAGWLGIRWNNFPFCLFRFLKRLSSHFADLTNATNRSFSVPTASASPINLKNAVFEPCGTIAATMRCLAPFMSINFAPCSEESRFVMSE